MATDDQVRSLRDLSDAIMNVDKDKLLRPSLGELSLQSVFAPTLEKIQQKFALALKYAPELHNDQLAQIRDNFTYISEHMREQVGRNSQDYATQRDHFLSHIESYLENLKPYWPSVVTVAVESRGFLEDEGIHREYERAVESMKQESETALKQVQGEAKRTIEQARDLAKQIENQARSTAVGISCGRKRRNNFGEAQEELEKRVKHWFIGGSCRCSVVCRCGYIFCNRWPPPKIRLGRWYTTVQSGSRFSRPLAPQQLSV